MSFQGNSSNGLRFPLIRVWLWQPSVDGSNSSEISELRNDADCNAVGDEFIINDTNPPALLNR